MLLLGRKKHAGASRERKRPRICFVNLTSSGCGFYGLLVAKAVQLQGEFEVFAIFDEGLLDSSFNRKIVTDVPYVTVKTEGNLAKIRMAADVHRYMNDFSPDIIHDTAGSAFPGNILVWPFAARLAPLHVTIHDPIPHGGMGGWKFWLLRYFFRRLSSRVWVHGPEGRDLLLAQGLAPSKISIVRHGELGIFDRQAYSDIPREKSTVLFFGELRPNKGIDFLPEIADRVADRVPNARFLVAGTSQLSRELNRIDWPRKLESILHAMRARDDFEVHEKFIPSEEVEFYFRRSAVTILPYRDASQSGIAMIAMPFGVPVVATRVGDLPYTINHNDTGLLCEPNPEAIAGAVIEILLNPAKAARLGDSARHFALTKCGWPAVAHVLCNSYRQTYVVTKTAVGK